MKRTTLFSLVLGLLLLLPVVGTVLAAPPLPAGFYGTVKVNDANVADGTAVTAWVNGTQYGTATTETDNGDSVYAIDVPGDDPDTPAVEGAAAGETIVFKVDGQEAGQTATWASGSNSELNLTVGPNAEFTCTPVSGSAPLEVTCTNASTGNITGWSWDFGDGTTSTDQNPAAHSYNANGNYTVSLTVTGPDGTDSHSLSITVQDNVIIPLVSAGDLAVDWASVIFPQTSLAGQDVLAYAIDETWTVTDTTNLGAGWHLTIVADDHLRGSGDPTNRVINVGTSEEFKVSCLDSEISTVSGDSTNLPSCLTGVQALPITGESPLTILTADAGDGMGAYNFVPHFQLLVPGTTIIDTYSTNIFVDAIAGP